MKIGDTVRFLNSVGGGRVARIEGNVAYVEEEDGFETPVLVKECVVVGKGDAAAAASIPPSEPAPALRKDTLRRSEVSAAPAPQLPGGDRINLCIGFEPVDLQTLSKSAFEASLVNDSNYSLFVTISSRASEDRTWTLRFGGLVQAGMQEFVFTLEQSDLTAFDRMAVQAIAFKEGMGYELCDAVQIEFKVDCTKFAKLHCFRPHRYFDHPALVYDILNGGVPAAAIDLAPLKNDKKNHNVYKPGPAVSKSSKPSSAPLVIDLHASELLDSTAGLSSADILNYQVDTFCKVMDSNLRNFGRKIVFIHGKGDGILRQALMKELTHRYKGHDVQDASFAEYGFGATQVTIKQTGKR